MTKDLKKQRDFSVHEAFKTIDRFNEGFLNEANLEDFFRCNGIQLIPSEVYAMIRRMSTHCDARISLEEFAQFLGEPISYGSGRPIDSSHRFVHRAKEFETPSRLDANIERSIQKMNYPSAEAQAHCH